MKLLRCKDYPGGMFTLAFVGYGEESETSVIAFVLDSVGYDIELIENRD